MFAFICILITLAGGNPNPSCNLSNFVQFICKPNTFAFTGISLFPVCMITRNTDKNSNVRLLFAFLRAKLPNADSYARLSIRFFGAFTQCLISKSSFSGLALLLPFCNYVDMFEYIPSARVTKKCHYYDGEDNLACTFGVWHPLAAEKLIAYQMNSADDRTVFQEGFVRITGFKKVRC